MAEAGADAMNVDKAALTPDASMAEADTTLKADQETPTLGPLEGWPLHTFQARLDQFKSRGTKKPQCVILTTGAMNPPHRGHAQLLQQARHRLEKEGYDVLAAWLSPTHDGYVRKKALSMGTLHLSGAFRLYLAKLMLHGDDFLALGAWEAQYPGHWPDFPKVVLTLQEELQENHLDAAPLLKGKNGSPMVFYACGTDHAKKCGLYQRAFGIDTGTVVVPRDGEKPGQECKAKNVFVAEPAPGDVATFSSTGIRNALKENNVDYIRSAIAPAAAEFLLQPTPAQEDVFAEDFKRLRQFSGAV